jgi:hypothetical protein
MQVATSWNHLPSTLVMPGLCAGIHVFSQAEENVDRRDKPGDDEKEERNDCN